MKSETQIRRQIRAIRSRRQKEDVGVRERAAIDAMIGALQWVINKEGHNPESHAMDAMIDDVDASGQYYGDNEDIV